MPPRSNSPTKKLRSRLRWTRSGRTPRPRLAAPGVRTMMRWRARRRLRRRSSRRLPQPPARMSTPRRSSWNSPSSISDCKRRSRRRTTLTRRVRRSSRRLSRTQRLSTRASSPPRKKPLPRRSRGRGLDSRPPWPSRGPPPPPRRRLRSTPLRPRSGRRARRLPRSSKPSWAPRIPIATTSISSSRTKQKGRARNLKPRSRLTTKSFWISPETSPPVTSERPRTCSRGTLLRCGRRVRRSTRR
mmetsp:Transcript_1815/g.4666  ORF Transcript_1815/g.4666 Transcript_1815/m.4666 type:complete len:243 (+) Transcript_1815:3891-4619(+)